MPLYIPEKTILYPDGRSESFGKIKMSPSQEDAALKLLVNILKATMKDDVRVKNL